MTNYTMTNYILTGNNDFYKALNEFKEEQKKPTSIASESSEQEELCLISNEPLEQNYIKLPCNHKFNYKPLLYAVIENSQIKYNHTKKQIKCPYCKSVYLNQVLPYNPLLVKTKYKNINWPQNNIICNNINDSSLTTCNYIYKSGKSKGVVCNKNAYWGYCHTHIKYLNKPICKTVPKNNTIDIDKIDLKTIGTDELKKMTVVTLKQIAKCNNKKNYSKLKKADLILFLKSE